MSALLNPYALLAALLALLAIVATSYQTGRLHERAAIAAKLQDGRITVLKDGKAIDDEVLRADDAGLCALLGGCELPAPPAGS